MMTEKIGNTLSIRHSPFTFFIGFLAIVLFVMGWTLLTNQTPIVNSTISPVDKNEITGCTGLDRTSYGISPAIFSRLPNPPHCFNSIMDAFRKGQFTDEFFFGKEFYSQPEFFNEFWEKGIEFWKNPLDTHYGAIGYGSFPFKKKIELEFLESKTIRFFLFSGFGTRTIQGVRIKYVFANSIDEELVSIQMDEESEKGFLLEPTFPSFEKNWVKPIDITLTSAQKISHSIVIYFFTDPPLTDLSNNPLFKIYPYFNATDFIGEKKIFTIEINPSAP